MTKKGIVFCHRCNKIVGTEFPIMDHHHNSYGNTDGAIWMLEHGMDGYGFYVDTPKMRKQLKKFKSRKFIKVPV